MQDSEGISGTGIGKEDRVNKRQKKKYFKSGRLLLEGREYSRKLRGIRAIFGKDITFEDYLKNKNLLIKLALQVVDQR